MAAVAVAPRPRTAALTHALADHAKPLRTLVGDLSMEILVQLVPLGWKVDQIKNGPNSFMLYHPNRPNEYHFRARRPFDGIDVRDAWTHGTTIFRLRTAHSRRDVLDFVAKVIERG